MTALELLGPRVTRDDALRLIGRRLGWRSRCWRFGKLELVYLPVYLVEATISRRRLEDREVLFAVDALDGEVRRLDREAGRRGPSASPGELFGTRLTPAEALGRAREEVPWLVFPLALRSARLRVADLRLRGRLGYPYWVRYGVRGTQWDFEALDGRSGARIGARGRARLLRAMLDQRREK